MDKVITDTIMLATSAGVAAYTSTEFSAKVAELYFHLAQMIPVLN